MNTAPFDCREGGERTTATVLDDGLLVGGRLLGWLDMDRVSELDHSLRLDMAAGDEVVITHAGGRFDELAAGLRAARGRARRAALAQTTATPIEEFEARARDGAVSDVLVFPNVLVVEERGGRAVSVPLPLVRSVDRDGWLITLTNRVLPPLALQGLGRRTDEFLLTLDRARTALRTATQAAYASLDGGLAGLDAPDGWAIGPAEGGSSWGALRRAVCGGDRAREATVLAALADEGLRLGLFTDGGRFPMPFLLASTGVRTALEATGASDSGATFVFATPDPERLNAALLLVAFRREVLYLPDDALGRWAVAVRNIEAVRWARAHLVDRVVHDAGWDDRITVALAG
jgi:hypothetical protein